MQGTFPPAPQEVTPPVGADSIPVDASASEHASYSASLDLDVIFAAAGSKQILTLLDGNANMHVHIMRIIATVTKVSAACTLKLKLVRITSAPAGGTLVSPTHHDSLSVAHTLIVRELPTTPGTQENTSPVGSHSLFLDPTSRATNMTNLTVGLELWDYEPGELAPLVVNNGSGEGWAVVLTSDSGVTVSLSGRYSWNEHQHIV